MKKGVSIGKKRIHTTYEFKNMHVFCTLNMNSMGSYIPVHSVYVDICINSEKNKWLDI